MSRPSQFIVFPIILYQLTIIFLYCYYGYIPIFLTNTLQFSIVIYRFQIDQDRFVSFLLALVALAVCLPDIIISNVLYSSVSTGTYEFMNIVYHTPTVTNYTGVLINNIVTIVFFAIMLMAHLELVFFPYPYKYVEPGFLIDIFIVCMIFTSLLTWMLAPTLQLYPNPHLLSIYVIWILLPSMKYKNTDTTVSNRVYILSVAFMALLIEILFFVIYKKNVPTWPSFNSIVDNTWANIQYGNLLLTTTQQINFMLHVFDISVLCVISIVNIMIYFNV